VKAPKGNKKKKAKKSPRKPTRRDMGAAIQKKSSPSYCYTKAGDDPTVSIWSGGFKVGEMSEAEAHAKGIPPCG
jgi:hypothetical protein